MSLTPKRLYSVEQLKSFPGYNYEFLAHMLNIFVNHSGRTMTDFAEGLAKGDVELLKGAAHRIRPSIDFLNVTDITDIIRKVEKWGTGFDSELATLVGQISGVLAIVIDQVKADLDNNYWR